MASMSTPRRMVPAHARREGRRADPLGPMEIPTYVVDGDRTAGVHPTDAGQRLELVQRDLGDGGPIVTGERIIQKHGLLIDRDRGTDLRIDDDVSDPQLGHRLEETA